MSLSENRVTIMTSNQVGHPIRALENTLRLLQLNHSAMHPSSSGSSSNEFKPSDYPGILDTDLTALTPEERLSFRVVVWILCVLSLCGNISTLGVNLRRKMRPFFRACLISLALSDLLNTVFLTTVYSAQFSTEYVQIWILGGAMCKLVPFTTTVAILASSLTLVIIALDRYFAVMKAFVSHWKPGHIAGVTCMLSIWIISLGLSSPIFWIYHIMSVYILTELDVGSAESSEQTSWEADASKDNLSYTLVKVEGLALMCVSDQQDVALFYIVIFSIIFVPCIVAFVWLNATIAKKIWIRRHRAQQNPADKQQQSPIKSMRNLKSKPTHPVSTDVNSIDQNTKSTKISTITTGYKTAENSSVKNNNRGNTREARHFRMVIVIVLLIAVFICMRLPAWIFLLMRMYGSYTRPHDWIVYFSLGILNMVSCALNPLFYTFLHETIQYILCCKMKCNVRKRKCCNSSACAVDTFDVGCCTCYDLFCGIFGICPNSKTSSCVSTNSQDGYVSEQESGKPRPLSLEKDEGVDCSDASYDDDDDDEDGDDDYDDNEQDFDNNENVSVNRNQQVFTVFSVSLLQVPGDRGFKDN